MIDLSAEIQAISSAVYAKEVRAAIVSAVKKLLKPHLAN